MNSDQKQNQNQLAVREETALAAPNAHFDGWLEGPVNFGSLSSLAQKFSKSELVPKIFQGKPENCFIALQVAHRAKEDPFEILQNLVVIHGNPSFKAKYLIARANKSPIFASRLGFRETVDPKNGLTVECYAILRETGEEVSMKCSMAMATAEGWVRSNPKYQTMPSVMLGYRSATFLVSRFAPEISLGLPTAEEMDDVEHAKRNRSQASTSTDALNARIEEIQANATPPRNPEPEESPL